mmetsp:Transcript_56002/g.131873  ORF Transcript_56002/g.131873 Transcript_56002/m.131873 type:complete len:359 (-) Transcript_56002:45-1121(-)|eukprot:CAMPEP_0177707724 /NCGR_PEP_ID=MMETSP0484_2-20121128/9901_1 /TAXON_ID=354590 /ORGANISM="Rhodomonas lens, Strain RHODO" /LENGTH=358 /DNA_ID=CAMNT_0019219251 /DNA_START=479 /DNA_END=1555 /DNA_ORIENTATION=+
MNRTVDSEYPARRDSDSLRTDTNRRDDNKYALMWERLKNPKVYGTVLAIVLCLILGVIFGAQVFEAIIGAKQWFLDNPVISIPWYCLLFSVASALAFTPYAPFCIAVGYIWGLQMGLLVQLCAIFLSSGLIYVLGRVLLKERIREHTQKYPRWRAIMDRMGSNWKEAAKLNVLMCFIPMPYGTHAYLFSVTECTFLNFVAFFELGMIGHTFLNLAAGNALAVSAELGKESRSGLEFTGLVLGVVATVVSIWYGGVVTQRIMDEQYGEDKVLVHHDALQADPDAPEPAADLEGGEGRERRGGKGAAAELTKLARATESFSVIDLVLEGGADAEQHPPRPVTSPPPTRSSPTSPPPAAIL